jgi:hypothetical protein
VSLPGESGTGEAILMAGLGHFKVISVDYRNGSRPSLSGSSRRCHNGVA